MRGFERCVKEHAAHSAAAARLDHSHSQDADMSKPLTPVGRDVTPSDHVAFPFPFQGVSATRISANPKSGSRGSPW